jgi:hypothetical protein
VVSFLHTCGLRTCRCHTSTGCSPHPKGIPYASRSFAHELEPGPTNVGEVRAPLRVVMVTGLVVPKLTLGWGGAVRGLQRVTTLQLVHEEMGEMTIFPRVLVR